jgi:hypothetical protein
VTDDGERTAERTAGSDATADRADRPVDDAAESFLDFETQLQAGGGTVRGRAVDVATVPAEAVPDDYPVEIGTAEVLALTLVVDALDEREVSAYFEWDAGRTDDRLGRLLSLYGVSQHRFGDLHGESILLDYRDGTYVPYIPAEGVRGDERGVYGVGLGLAVNLLAVALGAVGFGDAFSGTAALALLAVNVLLLPVTTYLDGWYLRTQTDWGQGPAFWAVLSMIPGLNLVSVPLYLNSRRKATRLID